MLSDDSVTNNVNTFMGCDYRVVNLGTHFMFSYDKLTNKVNTFMAYDYRVVNLETHNPFCQVIS